MYTVYTLGKGHNAWEREGPFECTTLRWGPVRFAAIRKLRGVTMVGLAGKVAVSVGGTSALLCAGLAYDYNTCHPMRKMQYTAVGAFVRLQNWAERNLIPAAPLSLSDLARYDGSAGGVPTYFAAGGLIYDASSSKTFSSSYGMWAGRDATVALARMSLNPHDVNRTDWETLTAAELDTLADWQRYFAEKYPVRGRLKEYNR